MHNCYSHNHRYLFISVYTYAYLHAYVHIHTHIIIISVTRFVEDNAKSKHVEHQVTRLQTHLTFLGFCRHRDQGYISIMLLARNQKILVQVPSLTLTSYEIISLYFDLTTYKAA